jgi:hypothetical protein
MVKVNNFHFMLSWPLWQNHTRRKWNLNLMQVLGELGFRRKPLRQKSCGISMLYVQGKALRGGDYKIRGLGWGVVAKPSPAFWECPPSHWLYLWQSMKQLLPWT